MSTPAKPAAKKAAKPKKPADHPKYIDMITKAVSSLKERSGSSRQAILKYIMANFNVGKDSSSVAVHLKMALKRGVVSGALKQIKGTGASGSFKNADKAAPKKKAAKPKKAKSPKKAAKKPAAKKPAAKKPAAKKAAKPKKAKSPKKTAAKPKKAKKPAAKKPAAKKAKKTPKKK